MDEMFLLGMCHKYHLQRTTVNVSRSVGGVEMLSEVPRRRGKHYSSLISILLGELLRTPRDPILTYGKYNVRR